MTNFFRTNPSSDIDKDKNKLKPEAHILSELLVMPTYLLILHTPKQIAEFISKAMIYIPGVSSCRVCLQNVSILSGKQTIDSCETCAFYSEKGDVHNAIPDRSLCKLTNSNKTRIIELETMDQKYGIIMFLLEAIDIYHIYEPFLKNFVNLIALILEKLHQSNLLEKTNEYLEADIVARKKAESALKEARDQLEQRVKDRTKKLEESNKRLQKEVVERISVEEELKKHRERLEGLINERTLSLEMVKEQAGAANYAKSMFFTNVSHELRTPLTGILGHSQILKNGKGVTGSQRKQLQIIQDNGEHLLKIINDILELGKGETEEPVAEKKIFNLRSLIKHVINITEIKAEEKELFFCYKDTTSLPLYVRGDEKKLKQVLLNLLSNSVKFTVKGGLTVSYTYSAETSNLFIFEVTDTGPGISNEMGKIIFEPFKQVHDQGFIDGPGLGLSISHKLVNMLDGKLYFESEVGTGTTFILELQLPLEKPVKSPKEKQLISMIDYRGRRKSVLAVDDNITSLSLLISILEPLGFKIETADNGKEAIKKIMHTLPDLILLDLTMPGMDGLDVLRQIKKNKRLKNTKVIGLSTAVLKKERKHNFEIECDDFILKPAKVESLLEKIRGVLHIEWLFGKQEFPVSSVLKKGVDEQAEVVPPKEIIDLLEVKTKMGDFYGVEKMITHLMEKDHKYFEFGQNTRKYSERFDDDALLKYLKNIKS